MNLDERQSEREPNPSPRRSGLHRLFFDCRRRHRHARCQKNPRSLKKWLIFKFSSSQSWRVVFTRCVCGYRLSQSGNVRKTFQSPTTRHPPPCEWAKAHELSRLSSPSQCRWVFVFLPKFPTQSTKQLFLIHFLRDSFEPCTLLLPYISIVFLVFSLFSSCSVVWPLPEYPLESGVSLVGVVDMPHARSDENISDINREGGSVVFRDKMDRHWTYFFLTKWNVGWTRHDSWLGSKTPQQLLENS